MTAANQKIVSAYEVLNMSPDDIANAEGFDLGAVKIILNQCSSKYRADCSGNDVDESLDFSDIDLVAANAVITQALYSDDEFLRVRAAKYIRNDKKGRLDIKRDLRQLNFNIIQINDHFRQAMESLQQSRMGQGGSPAQKQLDELVAVDV